MINKRHFSWLDAHRGSFRKRRRSHASNFSADTDAHPHHATISSGEPFDSCQKTHSDDDEFDEINNRPYPWIKTVVRIFDQSNSISDKQTRNCQNFFQALVNLYRASSTQQMSTKSTERKQRVIEEQVVFDDETEMFFV